MSVLTNSLMLMFITIVAGYYLGRIKIIGISLDFSGILIVAIIVGWIIVRVNSLNEYIDCISIQSDLSLFSSFGTSLFVSAIGIATGVSIDKNIKNSFKSIAIGVLMVVAAFLSMNIISIIDENITTSKLLGTLCGALTTTPGLSSACELKGVNATEVILGYGHAYIGGVIFTVLFVQLFKNPDREEVFLEDNIKENRINNKINSVVLVALTIVIGRMIGAIEISGISLGNSGGMLFIGIMFGVILKNQFYDKCNKSSSLAAIRDLGLALFFCGKGIPTGMQLSNDFDMKIVLYGAIITIGSIMVGYILCSFMLNKNMIGIVVAGGMTSTPALGVMIRECHNIPLGNYSLAYIGALFTIVVMIRLCF